MTLGSVDVAAGGAAATAPVLRVRDLGHTYGSGATAKQVLAGVSFDVGDGEFVSLVGPSGAGKTTLLRCLSGLQPPSEGGVVLDGEPVTGPPAGLALVFQDYSRSLLPWMTVHANVTLPLRSAGCPRRERDDRARQALSEVGLDGTGDRYPWQLSGGMQQRVSIARALAYHPRALLMDEPFASVDAQTRADLEDLVLAVRDRLGLTVLLVTHDIDEAVYVSDRVLVLGRSPATLVDDVAVALPTPRDQVSTKAVPAFAELRGHVLGLVRRRAPAAG